MPVLFFLMGLGFFGFIFYYKIKTEWNTVIISTQVLLLVLFYSDNKDFFFL